MPSGYSSGFTVPTTARRADEPLTGRRDGRIHTQAETGWRNIALTTAGVAVEPGELTVAVEVGESHRVGSVGHHPVPNQRAMYVTHLDAEGVLEPPSV
jgi:hypothetical protein